MPWFAFWVLWSAGGWLPGAHPDLLAERARFLQHEDTAPWDKILAPLVGIGGNLVPVAAGFDALYNWPPTGLLPMRILALVLLVAGYALGAYALIENRFFPVWCASKPNADIR